MLQRYPYLAKVPDDAPDDIDTPLPPPPPISWNDVGTVIPISPSVDSGQPEDHSMPDEGEHSPTWHDVALSIAAELMGKVREDIRVKFGYTTSAVRTML